MKKVIVTGGAGFLGSHLVDALIKSNAEVVVIDDLSSGLKENISENPGVTFFGLSVTDPAISDYFKGAACVFHLAAQVFVQQSIDDPVHSHEVNVNGTVHVLEAVRSAGVPRIVMVSSAAVYGSQAPLPVREDAPYAPESPYGLQKAIGEQYARLYESLYGIEVVIIRPFNLYGPRQRANSPYAGVIAKFAAQALAGEQPTIFGDGSNTRDFLSVHDAVRALVLSAQVKGAVGHTFNIGSGSGTTILETAQRIYSLCGRECVPVFEAARAGDIAKSVANASRIRTVLGWEAEISLDEGLRELIGV